MIVILLFSLTSLCLGLSLDGGDESALVPAGSELQVPDSLPRSRSLPRVSKGCDWRSASLTSLPSLMGMVTLAPTRALLM